MTGLRPTRCSNMFESLVGSRHGTRMTLANSALNSDRINVPTHKTSASASVLYNLLLCLQRLERYPYASRLWRSVWEASCQRLSAPVRTTIHGHKVIVNYGHTYPLTCRRVRTFDNPLVELVFQTASAIRRPLTLVDVGANVGDTILVLHANCPRMIDEFLCVDADAEFFSYLQNNLSDLKGGKFVCTLLSDSDGAERSLVRHMRSTASASGGDRMAAQTLDSAVAASGLQRIDVLKTDVDGLDGKVLLGSRQILAKHQPAVIFEWHPLLCRSASNNWSDHFDALEQCGYEHFIWYTKYGEFSHFSFCGERASLALLADLCLRSQMYEDWHYDVIALPFRYLSWQLSLAEMAYARRRRSTH